MNKEAVEKELKSFFGVKRQATTEKDIKERFPDLPPCVTNALNQVVYASYKKEKPDLLMGNRSLRSYKAGMPVTVVKKRVEFSSVAGFYVIVWKLRRYEQISRFITAKTGLIFSKPSKRLLMGNLI